MQKLLQHEFFKSKYAVVGIVGTIAVAFFLWQAIFGFSPGSVKVLDARITFKFTAYQNKDQYFLSYTLENKKKLKVKAKVRVQIGETSLGGRLFHSLKAQNDIVQIDALETKAFVVQMEIPKAKNGKERELDVCAKVKHVSRA